LLPARHEHARHHRPPAAHRRWTRPLQRGLPRRRVRARRRPGGSPGDGWPLARTTLANERVAMGGVDKGMEELLAFSAGAELDSAPPNGSAR
ncbi:hypothetical protein H7H37_05560, partial [Mycolicibacterium insubricum]|nr:hypothetical protein [Mycolicibacterium insubricum]